MTRWRAVCSQHAILPDISTKNNRCMCIIGDFAKLRSYIKSSVPTLFTTIKSEKKLSPENEEVLKKAIADVKAM